MISQPYLYGVDVLYPTQFPLHGSYVFVVYATGDNITEIIQIGIDIKRETVHGYPSTGPHPQRAYFPRSIVIRVQPYTGITRITAGFDTIVGQRKYDGLLQRTQV